MTVESVTYITDLDNTYPASGDDPSEGDNHIRNIKTGLGNTFANFTGIAVTATEAELNILDGVTATTAEINLLDGATAATGTTLAAADRVIVNDAGTMKQVALSDFETFMESNLDTLALTTLTIGGNTAATLGSNTFTGTQNITVSGDTSGIHVRAETGQNADIRLIENSITALLIRNDASANTTVFYKNDGVGTRVGALSWGEDGILNVETGTLQLDGSDAVSAANTITLTNKTLTSPVLNTGVSGTAVLDEDDMASDSATQLATQQSIKAYVDTSNAYRGATAYRNSAQSVTSGTVTALSFDTEYADTDSIFSTGSNPTRLTVPSGVTKIKLRGGVTFIASSGGTYRYAFIAKNGAAGYLVYTSPDAKAPNGFVDDRLTPFTSTLTVTGSDYFELKVQQDSGGALSTYGWMEMEIIE